MTRHGCYVRTDIRNGAGEKLAPLPIQRWKCKDHGVASFLPPFLARWMRYLVSVVGSVVKCMLSNGRPNFPLEVTGPEPGTARRWFNFLLDPDRKRWLEQRLQLLAPPASSGPAEVVDLAERYALQLNLHPLYFFRTLTFVNLHATPTYF